MSSHAYCTIVTTEDYIIAAQTLAKSLKRFSQIPLVAIVNRNMNYQPLVPYFNIIVPVEPIYSRDNRINLIDRPLESTFTKFYAWTLNYSKVVYLDSDMIILKNIDELFKNDELSAVSDVGWPDCFNSGLLVLKPNYATFEQLRFQAVEFGSFDGADQGLLNDYFPKWNRLPFIYNVTISVEPVYSYKPAYLRFKDDVKVLHYFGASKPWNHSHSSNSVINDLLQIWWDVSRLSEISGSSAKIEKIEKAAISSFYDSEEPRVLNTMIINNQEFVVDNNQSIPYNPYHQFNPKNDKRQQSINKENMRDFATYRCDWNDTELSGIQGTKKEPSFFEKNSLKDLTIRNNKDAELDEDQVTEDYMALSRESVFSKRK
eukprot:NODE_256_length_12667_cov_0.196292.p3 type:complete len:373 gc:universal NODE_256_length_12667_cov_0.196292:1785-667(-)